MNRLRKKWKVAVIIVVLIGLLVGLLYFYEQTTDLKQRLRPVATLEEEKSQLEKDKSQLQADCNELQKKYNDLLRETPDCPDCPQVEELEDPDVIDDISFEDLLDLLRDVFPEAMRAPELSDRERDDFDAVELEEIERFLEWDNTDELDLFGNRSVFRLHGQFMRLGWEKIPFGYAKESDGDIYNIVVVKDGKKLRVYEINPETDKVKRVDDEEEDVIFVLV